MQTIINFLSSPAWQGIQGMVAVIAIVLSLSRPREWAEQHQGTKWAVRVPWIFLLVAVGVAAGFGLGVKFGDIYRGLSVALFSACLALGIHSVKSLRLARATGSELTATAANHQRLLKVVKRLADLQQASTDYRLDNRKMVHRIDAHGNGTLYEEFTVVATQNPVFFYFVGHTFIEDPASVPKVTATALSDGTPLTVQEIDRSNNYARYVVLLDPPSTVSKSKRIAINCERKAIWGRLLQQKEDDGVFRLSYASDAIRIEFEAPPGKTWKGFHATPEVGNIVLEPPAERIVWTIADPPKNKYSYQVFLH